MPRHSMAVALLASLLLPVFSHAEDWDARLSESSGEVTVYTADEPEGVPANGEFPLHSGDRIKTGSGASAEISLDDGHVIRLRELSDFTLSSVDKSQTEFTLALGSFLAKVQKLLGGHEMRVRTHTAVASVRGTEFAVEIEGASTHVGVFDEGKVEVKGDTGAAELLGANMETLVGRGQAPSSPYILKKFARHRPFMREKMRARHKALRARWKKLPAEKRLELRKQWLQNRREHKLRGPGKQRSKDIKEMKRGGRSPEEIRKMNEEMKKRKERILRNRGGDRP